MFKKNSWIVALVLALAVTALFTGCIDALEPEPEVTYTEVDLGAFNIWGGQAYQKGWAVAGIKFLGLADKPEVAKDLGYKNDDFAAATKLVLEVASGKPGGNLDIIWGGELENGSSAGDWVQTGGIPYTKDGDTLTIDLTAMKDYGKYKAPNIARRKLVLQAGGDGDPTSWVKSAKLLIPDVGYIPVTGLELVGGAGSTNFEVGLDAEVTPSDATNQVVHWSIISFTTSGGTVLSLPASSADSGYAAAKAALLAKVDFTKVTYTWRPEESYTFTDWTVLPPVTVTIAGAGALTSVKYSENEIVATEPGTVKVRATIENGKAETGTAAVADFVKDFDIVITDKALFSITIGSTVTQINNYNLGENGAKGGYFKPRTDGNGFALEMKEGYGNTYGWFKVDFGAAASTFTKVTFKYKSISGDSNYKNPRIKAMATRPPVSYNPGVYISTTGETGDASDGVELVGTFGTDEANIYGGAGTMSTNWDGVKTNSSLYIWILPWSGPCEYEVYDIVFE